jgi:hypothetical protein
MWRWWLAAASDSDDANRTCCVPLLVRYPGSLLPARHPEKVHESFTEFSLKPTPDDATITTQITTAIMTSKPKKQHHKTTEYEFCGPYAIPLFRFQTSV